ncbi:MATE family efflux transporter [Candidatus Izemoplasma sp. B36]|uniref:MATE family efflux transporter n=1 Tax=Candidatus Izemoplasma sp. B36 TaxID=3242468 RepID=UPI0035573F24
MSTQFDQKSKLILQDRPIWKGIVSLALPVFLANILKTVHDLVDTYFLGQVDDPIVATQMQSGISLTWPIFFVFIAFGMGLSVAGNALVGQYLGNKDQVNAQKYATNTIYVSIILGVLFTALAFFVGPLILKLMGVEGDTLKYAILYIRIRAFELPILFLSYAFQSIKRATGDTTTPVLISTFAIIVNIILTPVLVLHFNMGIAGAALATLLAHIFMLPMLLYFLVKSKKGLTVSFKVSHINIPIIKDIFKIGLPASTGQSIQAVGFIVLQAFIYSYTEAVTSAFFIGNRINSIIMFPVSSISAVVAVYVAQNIGAGNIKRAKSAVKQGILMSVSFMAVGVLLIMPFRRVLVEIFTHNPDTIMYATEYMIYVGISLPFVGIFQNYLSTFQGSGDTNFSFWLAIIRLWAFRLPLVAGFIYLTDLGPSGIWLAMLISNLLAIIVGTYFYSKVKFLPKIRLARQS